MATLKECDICSRVTKIENKKINAVTVYLENEGIKKNIYSGELCEICIEDLREYLSAKRHYNQKR